MDIPAGNPEELVEYLPLVGFADTRAVIGYGDCRFVIVLPGCRFDAARFLVGVFDRVIDKVAQHII